MIPLKDDNPAHCFPLVNLGLILINLVVFIYPIFYQKPAPEDMVLTLGFIPFELSHWTDLPPANLVPLPLTMISSMFVHAGLLHIFGNMIFLWVFGDNIEDRLGHLRYLAFYLACGVTAALVHGVLFADSRVPTVGASGAVSGVLAAYLILFPRARVTTLFIFVIFIRTIRLPAFMLLGLWIALQVVNAVNSFASQAGGIAWFAHIGGFVAGILFLFFLKPARRRKAVSPRT
jgi:membrane associated rhomboid family serine protease